MEKKDFDIHDVEEVISLSGCEEMSATTLTVKEEMYSEESSEVNLCPSDNIIDTVLINSNETVPFPVMEKEPESINDMGTPFFFAGIKMENPDDYESEASCANSETKYSCEEYTSSQERECNIGDQCSEGKLPTELCNTSCIEVKTECEENIVSCKSDFQTNEDTSVTIDENSKFDCRSVVGGCDMGHSSNEFIIGIECQEYPILRVKEEEEKTDKEITVNRKNSGILCSVGAEDEKGLNKVIEEQETLEPVACDTVYSPEKNYEIKCHPSKGKGFSCEIRHPTLDKSDNLKQLSLSHLSEKPDSCYICGKSFRENRYLKEHIRTHSAEKSFECGVCKAVRFPSRSKLQAHMRTHTGEKPFSCALCKASYSQKGTLERHLRTHTDEKPYSCNVCETSFARKDGLKMHMATHTVEKPYSCDVCKASFSVKGALKRHMRSHSGEKPFSCVVCETSFALKYHMRRHMLTHTDHKAFSCHICKASFARKDRVLVHLRTHSREKT